MLLAKRRNEGGKGRSVFVLSYGSTHHHHYYYYSLSLTPPPPHPTSNTVCWYNINTWPVRSMNSCVSQDMRPRKPERKPPTYHPSLRVSLPTYWQYTRCQRTDSTRGGGAKTCVVPALGITCWLLSPL